jgi:ParB-like chromosome segregation protein Spo0J
MLEGEELAALAEDIRANGQHEPVLVWQEQVIDGRNRLAACALAGIEPTVSEFEGTELDAILRIYSANLHRRHLSALQRAAIVLSDEALIAELRASRPHGGVREQGGNTATLGRVDAALASVAGVSERTLRDARAAIAAGRVTPEGVRLEPEPPRPPDPDLATSIKKGTVKVTPDDLDAIEDAWLYDLKTNPALEKQWALVYNAFGEDATAAQARHLLEGERERIARRRKAEQDDEWKMNDADRERSRLAREAAAAAEAEAERIWEEQHAAQEAQDELVYARVEPICKAAVTVDGLLGHVFGTVEGPERDEALIKARKIIQKQGFTVAVVRTTEMLVNDIHYGRTDLPTIRSFV